MAALTYTHDQTRICHINNSPESYVTNIRDQSSLSNSQLVWSAISAKK